MHSITFQCNRSLTRRAPSEVLTLQDAAMEATTSMDVGRERLVDTDIDDDSELEVEEIEAAQEDEDWPGGSALGQSPGQSAGQSARGTLPGRRSCAWSS